MCIILKTPINLRRRFMSNEPMTRMLLTYRPIALWLLTCVHTYGIVATDVHTNYNAVVGDVHTDL